VTTTETEQAGFLEETVLDIAEALGYLTDAVPELQVTWHPNLSPTPPAMDIYPGDPAQEGLAFDHVSGRYTFTVRALIGTADFVAGYTTLLRLMDRAGPGSVNEALRLLGPAWNVTGPSGLQAYPVGGRDYLGVQWTLTLLAGRGH
jgi:hypothetical protein